MKTRFLQNKDLIIVIATLIFLIIIFAVTGVGTKLDHLLPASKIVPLPQNLTNPTIPTNLTFVK